MSVGPPKSWWANNTILVGKKGKLNNYSLCDFAAKSENHYVKTFQTKADIEISHYINVLSFSYKEGDEFDLFVYSVQVGNSKLVLLYEVISGKFGSINKQLEKIENKFDDNHVQQSFARDDMI